MNFTFQYAENKDLNSILEIWKEGITNIYPDLIIQDIMVDKFTKNFNKRKYPYLFWLVKLDEEILAWVSVLQAFSNPVKYLKEGEISIYVKPNYENKNIGTELTQYVLNEIAKTEIEIIWAFVSIRNIISRKMCENVGMQLCGRTSTKLILIKEF